MAAGGGRPARLRCDRTRQPRGKRPGGKQPRGKEHGDTCDTCDTGQRAPPDAETGVHRPDLAGGPLPAAEPPVRDRRIRLRRRDDGAGSRPGDHSGRVAAAVRRPDRLSCAGTRRTGPCPRTARSGRADPVPDAAARRRRGGLVTCDARRFGCLATRPLPVHPAAVVVCDVHAGLGAPGRRLAGAPVRRRRAGGGGPGDGTRPAVAVRFDGTPHPRTRGWPGHGRRCRRRRPAPHRTGPARRRPGTPGGPRHGPRAGPGEAHRRPRGGGADGRRGPR